MSLHDELMDMEKLDKEITTLSKKLGNEGFLAKAPKDVIEKTKDKQTKLIEKYDKLKQNLEKIKSMK